MREFWLLTYVIIVVISGMLDNFVNEIKQEYIEEDYLEIEHDFKQEDEEAHCSSFNQHIKIENVQYNCQKQENFVWGY